MMPISAKETFVLLFNSIFTASVLIALGILLGFTLKNVLQNRTTIEQLEVQAEEKYSRRFSVRPIEFPYDLDIQRNLMLVLGKRCWAWPFPLPSNWQLSGLGEGISFATRPGLDPDSWPPGNLSSSSDSSDQYDEFESGDDRENSSPLLDHHQLREKSKSQDDIKYRIRRDSEGQAMLPTSLPWHSLPNLSLQ